VKSTHWTSDTPIDTGWYWYRARSHPAVMLRIDEHGVVDSPEQFDRNRATDLVGDWLASRIKSAWAPAFTYTGRWVTAP